MKNFKKPSHRQLNNFLSLVVVVLSVYILIWPLLPAIGWRLSHYKKQPTPTQLSATILAKPKDQNVLKANTLVVPRMDLSQEIHEGSNNFTLEKGAWRRPKTSSPDIGGNTVIVGHRFSYSSIGTFYHLDKIQVDDLIVVYWQGKQYDYKVASSAVVPATQLSVEENTKEPQLTLYTCTPLWSFKDRLVIVAKPIGEKI